MPRRSPVFANYNVEKANPFDSIIIGSDSWRERWDYGQEHRFQQLEFLMVGSSDHYTGKTG
jgi:hypothetical protein